MQEESHRLRQHLTAVAALSAWLWAQPLAALLPWQRLQEGLFGGAATEGRSLQAPMAIQKRPTQEQEAVQGQQPLTLTWIPATAASLAHWGSRWRAVP